MTVDSSQRDLIRELFVRTADETYIVARWSGLTGLQMDFLWLAAHCLEKYIKPVLLENGQSVRSQGHDIARLYSELTIIAEELLPKTLSKPPSLVMDYWPDWSPTEFVEHLQRGGDPHNRYQIFGYVTFASDLHMLDTMVFAIRRLICRLDEPIAAGSQSDWRDYLLKSTRYARALSMPLDDLIQDPTWSEKKYAALNLNMEFAPPDFSHHPALGAHASRNPAILRRILEPLKSTNVATVKEAVEVACWLKSNVFLPRDVRRQIADAIVDAADRMPVNYDD